jgi:hypothetical protein
MVFMVFTVDTNSNGHYIDIAHHLALLLYNQRQMLDKITCLATTLISENGSQEQLQENRNNEDQTTVHYQSEVVENPSKKFIPSFSLEVQFPDCVAQIMTP